MYKHFLSIRHYSIGLDVHFDVLEKTFSLLTCSLVDI